MADVTFLVARYYILYIKDLAKIRCLPYHFPSRELAKHTIKKTIPYKERKLFKVVSGRYLCKYRVDLYNQITLNPTKYKYPPEKMTHQARKTYRTVLRRRLRRMGILVVGKNTGRIKTGTRYLKAIKNKQKVAQSPKTNARIVTVDSMGIHNYYLLIKLLPNPRKGDLCFARTWCFDTHRKRVYKKRLRIRNIDVVTPYLTKHLVAICLKKSLPVPKSLWTKLSTGKLSPLKSALSKGG